MSSYVFMRVLESSAHRYDRGLRLLSMGRIGAVYRTIAARVAAPGRRILDIGCGTGGVALACAERGAGVVGIDINAEMLEVARSKPVPRERGGDVEWLQLGAAEIEDRFPPESLDAVVACLVFSELSPQERDYVLGAVLTRLRPGGGLVIADEVRLDSAGGRAAHWLRRLPLVLVTYLLTQTTTRAVPHLSQSVRDVGFVDVDEERLQGGAFAIVHGKRLEECA